MTNAAESGRFRIGGAFDVNRLGYGAMRIVGKGIWGPTPHRDEALKTLRRLPELGVDFIDTADSYGPNFSEELIKEALAPYGKIHVATKGGLTRTGENIWIPFLEIAGNAGKCSRRADADDHGINPVFHLLRDFNGRGLVVVVGV